VYAAISTAEGEAWRQAGLLGNPSECSNGTMERTADDLHLLARQNIPNNNISIVTYTIMSI
jgi:hypothetical protein